MINMERKFTVFTVAIVFVAIITLHPDEILEPTAAFVANAMNIVNQATYASTGIVPWRLVHWLTILTKEGAMDFALTHKLVDVHTTDSKGATPLHYAASHCHGWAVEVLLKHSADTKRLDPVGKTALQLAIDASETRPCAYALALLEVPDVPSQKEIETAISSKQKIKLSEVPRYQIDEFSFDEYAQNFGSKKRAVVIENAIGAMGSRNFDLAELLDQCGDKIITPKSYEPNLKDKWAGIAEHEDQTLREFLQNYPSATLRVFDQVLSKLCPDSFWLRNQFALPEFIMVDFVRSLSKKPMNNTPSLFLDSKHMRSGMHIDSMNTSFWMLILKGGKTFRLFDDENRRLLYSNRSNTNFASDAFDLDYEKYPLLRFVRGEEAILKEGDLLIIPGGMIHQVKNDLDTFALSGNFVDEFSWPDVKKNAEREKGKVESRATKMTLIDVSSLANHRHRLLNEFVEHREGVKVLPFTMWQEQFQVQEV